MPPKPASQLTEDGAINSDLNAALSAELQKRLEQACQDAVDQLNRQLFYERPMPQPQLSLKLRGRCAGQAHYQNWELRFNKALLEKYQQRFIDETAAHEVAHLAVMHHIGGVARYQHLSKQQRPRPHGKEWRAIMAILGADAKVTHQFETQSSRQSARVDAQCGCDKVTSIGKIQAKRLQEGERKYYCRYCGRGIVLV